MATRMQQRKGTEAQWISTNNGNGPVLNAGEIGYETDTNKFKIGDGINHWVDLNYFADEVALGGNIDDYIPLTQRGTANGVATLDEDGVIPSSQIPSLVGLDTEITAAVDAAINSLIDGAPAALNTLNELAAAVNDDASFASSVTTALNAKAPTANPTFTGTVAGVTKSHVGLANVDNTSDADKPVSTAVATALSEKLSVSSADAAAVEAVTNKLNEGTGITIASDPTTKQITIGVDATIATETYADGVGTDAVTEAGSYTDTAVGTAVENHNDATTNVHGITDTAALVTLTGTQELTNKTLVSPTISIGQNQNIEITSGGFSNSTTFIVSTPSDSLAGATNLLVGNTSFLIGENYQGTYAIASVSGSTLTFAPGIIPSGLSSALGPGSGLNSGDIAVQISGASSISATEIGYLDGLTTNINTKFGDIDTALGTKANSADIEELAQDAVGGSIGTGLSYDTGTNVLSVDTSAIQARVTDVSDTEIGYLNGVTSLIQDQLDDKAPLSGPTFTGTTNAADVIISGDLTVSGTTTTVSAQDLVVTDPLIYIGEGNSGNLVDLGLVSSFDDGTYQHAGIVRDASDGKWKIFKGVTDEPTTTINFGQGSLDALSVGAFEATSATIASDTVATLTATQTLTNKTLTGPKIVVEINPQTASYTLVAADASDFVEISSSSGTTLTVPANSSVAYAIGTVIHLVQTGTGQITIAGAGGVTVNGTPGLKTRAQWSAVTLVKRATDTWVAFGDLTA